jgi:hypothetical protein
MRLKKGIFAEEVYSVKYYVLNTTEKCIAIVPYEGMWKITILLPNGTSKRCMSTELEREREKSL